MMVFVCVHLTYIIPWQVISTLHYLDPRISDPFDSFVYNYEQ
jgi:hypothetical protein